MVFKICVVILTGAQFKGFSPWVKPFSADGIWSCCISGADRAEKLSASLNPGPGYVKEYVCSLIFGGISTYSMTALFTRRVSATREEQGPCSTV